MRSYYLIIFYFLCSVANVSAQDNWMLLPSFPSGPKTSAAVLSDSILFTSNGYGIYRSGTTGSKWKKVLRTSMIYSLHASPSGKIIAGSEGKLYISFNKGLDWDSVKLQTRFPVKAIAESSNGDLYFITGILDESLGYIGDGVFYNSGDLKNWINKTPGLHTTGYCEQITTDRFNRVYVTMGDEYVTGQAGLFISDDKGSTWTHAKFLVKDLGEVKTANTYSVNITPTDSVIVSVAGTVTNFSVSLNLIKHRDDLMKDNDWKVITVRTTSSWWMDLLLNPIHFAADGSWYSSVSGSASQGGVFISKPGGHSWSKFATGLGPSQTLQYESFAFFEDSYGRIFASQFLDDRLYITTRSMTDAVIVSGKIIDDQGAPMSARIENSFFATNTNLNGEYNLKLPRNWSGTITPRATQYTFDPENISIKSLQQDLSNQNFTGTYTGTHWVWGFVKDANGYPISEVVVTGFGVELKTNEYGAFFTSVPHGWSGEISLSLNGWDIAPATLQIDPVYSGIYAFEFVAKESGKFIVSGTVKDTKGNAIPDAIIEGFPETTRINQEGEYTVQLPEGWSGEIKVSHPDFIFSPEKLLIENLDADLSEKHFVGTANKLYRVSGVIKDKKLVALADVQLLGLPAEVKTNASGNFELELPAAWSGTITPVKHNYVFEPASITISSLKEDQPAIAFSATYVGNYVLSGFIRMPNGEGLANVEISGLPVITTTNATGFYSASVPAGWSGTLMPEISGYTFSPSSFTIDKLDQNKEQVNFSAAIITSVPDEEILFEVFPNPSADGVVQIQLPDDLKSARLTITSSTGQIIHRFEPCTINTSEKIRLPQSGVFMIAVVYENKSYFRKIVVL